MNVEPNTPLIGAEVSGVDLASLSDNEFGALKDAFTQHSVLFFRDQPELAPEVQVEFAKRLGPLHTHPAAPAAAFLGEVKALLEAPYRLLL